MNKELCGTFISLGNSKNDFSRAIRLIELAEHLLPRPIVAQIGHTNYLSPYFNNIKFVTQSKFIQYVALSKLIISHAGAGVIINCLKEKKKPIVIPRLSKFDEHIDDHQLNLAKKMEAVKLAFYVNNSVTLIELLKDANGKKFKYQNDNQVDAVKLIETEICIHINK
jgi:UDP-N-acetylglucosamine transferase subunit ALG13